jgi:hypothetical protein
LFGTIGFHLLKHFGYAQSHAAEGSIGSNVIGGLIFAVGFALLGCCPGTVAGAVGTGAIDALIGVMVSLLIGAGFFAEMYPRLRAHVLIWGKLPVITVPDFLKLNQWIVTVLMEILMIGFLIFLEYNGCESSRQSSFFFTGHG